MCDYSLHAQPNRLARAGEELVLTRFPGGSRGFTSLEESEAHACQARQSRDKVAWTWKGLLAFLKGPVVSEPLAPLTAVCVPPGARLRLEGIPRSLQRDLAVGGAEEVTFTQLSYDAYAYRDAVRFENGKQVSLQQLAEKVRATVLSLGDSEEEGVETSIRAALAGLRA
jgi:hypothetical protein